MIEQEVGTESANVDGAIAAVEEQPTDDIRYRACPCGLAVAAEDTGDLCPICAQGRKRRADSSSASSTAW